MKKYYYYIELLKDKAYLLYEISSAKDFKDVKSLVAIGDKREMQNAFKNLPSECTIMYHTMKDVTLAKDGTAFELDFKKYLTKNFTEAKKEDKNQ